MAAGMAANSPRAVASNARAMPGATVRMLVEPVMESAVERVDNPQDSAEQTDERRNSGSGSQPAHVALQPGYFFADPQLKRPFQSRQIGDRPASRHLAGDFAEPKIKHSHQRRGPEFIGLRRDIFQARSLAEHPQESQVPALGSAEAGDFGENDRPGKHGKQNQNRHDGQWDRLRTFGHLPEIHFEQRHSLSL